MKQIEKLASLFPCLFWRKASEKSPDSERMRLLPPSISSTDCVSQVGQDRLEGYSNDGCGSVGGDLNADCEACRRNKGVESSLASSVSALPESAATLTVRSGSPREISSHLSSKFVFVMAADIDETERLDQQVKAFCQELERYGIGHVVVRSTSQTPLVALHPSVIENLPPLLSDFRSVQKFVGSCYKRAAKVLMLVTPGYLLYADGCAEGSQKAETLQQKLMRKIQEKLKEEFCNRDIPFRIWPVLLHEMKAHRLHLPFFLSDAVYYWFPLKPGAENVMEVLVEDLCVRSADVKRSI